MRLLPVLVALLVTACVAAPVSRTLQQRVDHFDPLNVATFTQRYAINDAAHSNRSSAEGAFIVLITDTIDDYLIGSSSPLYKWAASASAVLLNLELRYTGQSFPAQSAGQGDVTWLRFNTIEQILADILVMQQAIGPSYGDTGPHHNWVFVGEGFAGSVAAWFRSKYPQRSLGAIALDAPMLLTSAFDGEDLRAASILSSACAADVRRVLPTLQKAQCDCATLSDADFAYAANNILTGLLMTRKSAVCAALSATNASDATSQMMQGLLASSKTSCAQWTVAGTPSAEARLFLQCKQRGQFSVSAGKNGLMSPTIDLAWYTTQCEQLFGAPFRPSDLQLTQFTFGSGRDTLFTASNVIYVTADVDQFYMLQLWQGSETKDAFVNQRLLSLEQVGSASVLSAGVSDSVVVSVRNKLSSALTVWLSETDPSHQHQTMIYLALGSIIAVLVFGGAFYLFAYLYKKRKHHYEAVAQIAATDPEL